MGNENEITDKTYTLNSKDSYFDNGGISLQILLPENVAENPYLFSAFDISQLVNGQQQNALFVYMKKVTDDASDLSGSDDDLTEVNTAFKYNELIAVDKLPGYSAFNIQSNDTLLVIYHDASDDDNYKKTCAEKAFDDAITYVSSVIANGNFQCTLQLMGPGPKKAGMSSLPRR